ncbi:MAG: plasmid pRiA4b ORF-3 family protein [Candidatus Sumerlaeia bacterium]|nr:plasmid pRiA4b ORF-3 family protein [Candidatus Sumerlaeia bacterium]
MAKRIAACGEKLKDAEAGFLLLIEGLYQPKYWLYLNAPAEATLVDLDVFLRKIWVECCGHLSKFTIGGTSYVLEPRDSEEGDLDEDEFDEDEEDLFDEEEEDDEFGGDNEDEFDERDDLQDDLFDAKFMEDEEDDSNESMGITLGEVLQPKMKFSYEYDFGTPTKLSLKVVDVPKGKAAGREITLLARNNPPEIPCSRCGKPATKICLSCIYGNEAWFCTQCAEAHTCSEKALFPVANSPRVGMCGYVG